MQEISHIIRRESLTKKYTYATQRDRPVYPQVDQIAFFQV